MSIYHLEQAKELREQGKRLGRVGLSQRVNDLVLDFAKEHPEGHYREAIKLAGRLHAIFLATKADGYWIEKAQEGFTSETYDLRKHELRHEDVTYLPGEPHA